MDCAPLSPSLQEKVHVLLVEDDHDVSLTRAECLMDGGYGVTCVHDLPSARDALRGRNFAVALVDYLLPGGGNGSDLADVARGSGTRMILMSGHPGIAQRSAALDLPFVAKPCRVDNLLRVIAATLAGAPGYGQLLPPLVG
jgi:DNA-binding NtrC family response regulator